MTYHQSHIDQRHFDEWVTGSGVDEDITVRAIQSLSHPEDIANLLNRNPKHRGQIKGVLAAPGWAVVGVDPKTGDKTWEGAQFKPDTPIQRYKDGQKQFKKDGSPDYQKYFSASGCETAPLFLDPGKGSDFWQKVRDDITIRIIWAEGAKKAGAALTAGEVCISLPGVTNGQRKGRLKKNLELFCQPGRVIVLGFDSDMFHNPNVCKALNKLGCLLLSHGCVVRVMILPRETKGLDDYIVAYGPEAFRQLVDNAMTFEEWRDEFIVNAAKEVKTATSDIPDAEENYQLKAQQALFSDRPWVSIDGQLYEWDGTHYQTRSEAAIRRRIADWCRVTPVWTRGDGEWCYSYATATHISNIYSWVVESFGVDPGLVNPPGLNCLNGVLKIQWQKETPRWELVKHDPSIIYTYVGEFEYNPDADSSVCDRLLECLEPPQREILIKTLASSLDLATIRKFRSRVKALLCKGDGNNGKDSVREAVDFLYGIGVSGCTFSDFEQYDQGRKFPLAKLAQSRVNWASENSDLHRLDNLQCLKKAITGEALDYELKNQGERPMKPSCVFFFNINNVPNLQASMEAIKSRYAVLSFDKTFKIGADLSRGELEAEPRFRYDPQFIKTEVVPSLLNKMLAVLPEVAMNGINYDCTESALQTIQEETNHLWSFAREVGLNYQVGGRVYINNLWEMLEQWYIKNGTLIITTDGKKEKREWHDQPRRSDKNVKGANQVFQRFAELFPKIRKERDNSTPDKKGQFYISGLGLGDGGETPQQMQVDRSIANQILELFQRLPLDEQTIVRERLIVADQLHGASRLEPESVTASPTASPSFPTASPSSPTASPSSPAITITEPTISNQDSCGSVAAGVSGNVSVDNSKNFSDSNTHDFKVGDKCRVKYSNIYGVPNDADLTIQKIEGEDVTITYPGCRSVSGVTIPVCHLYSPSLGLTES